LFDKLIAIAVLARAETGGVFPTARISWGPGGAAFRCRKDHRYRESPS